MEIHHGGQTFQAHELGLARNPLPDIPGRENAWGGFGPGREDHSNDVSCCEAAFNPGAVFCRTYSRLDAAMDGRDAYSDTKHSGFGRRWFEYTLTIPFYFIWNYRLTAKIRNFYHIHGSRGSDLLEAIFCPCVVLMRLEEEILIREGQKIKLGMVTEQYKSEPMMTMLNAPARTTGRPLVPIPESNLEPSTQHAVRPLSQKDPNAPTHTIDHAYPPHVDRPSSETNPFMYYLGKWWRPAADKKENSPVGHRDDAAERGASSWASSQDAGNLGHSLKSKISRRTPKHSEEEDRHDKHEMHVLEDPNHPHMNPYISRFNPASKDYKAYDPEHDKHEKKAKHDKQTHQLHVPYNPYISRFTKISEDDNHNDKKHEKKYTTEHGTKHAHFGQEDHSMTSASPYANHTTGHSIENDRPTASGALPAASHGLDSHAPMHRVEHTHSPHGLENDRPTTSGTLPTTPHGLDSHAPVHRVEHSHSPHDLNSHIPYSQVEPVHSPHHLESHPVVTKVEPVHSPHPLESHPVVTNVEPVHTPHDLNHH